MSLHSIMNTKIVPFTLPTRGEVIPFTLPTRAARIAMHLRCLWRRPAHWRFHAAGLLREFFPAKSNPRGSFP